jgi:hypothetical protein
MDRIHGIQLSVEDGVEEQKSVKGYASSFRLSISRDVRRRMEPARFARRSAARTRAVADVIGASCAMRSMRAAHPRRSPAVPHRAACRGNSGK